MTTHPLNPLDGRGPHPARGDRLTLADGRAAVLLALLCRPERPGSGPVPIVSADPPCRSAERGGMLQHAPADWPWSCPKCGRIYTHAELGDPRPYEWEQSAGGDREHAEHPPALANLPSLVRTAAGAAARALAADYRHAAAAHLLLAARLVDLDEDAGAVAAATPGVVSAEAAATAATATTAATHRQHADALAVAADKLEGCADAVEPEASNRRRRGSRRTR